MNLAEHLERPSTTWKFVLATAPLAVLVVFFGGLAGINQLAAAALQPLWDASRNASQLAGVITAGAMTFRLGVMAGDVARWHDRRSLHLLAWFTWIVGVSFLASLAARYYDQLNADATWISGARLALHVVAFALCVWWPHPHHHTPTDTPRPATP